MARSFRYSTARRIVRQAMLILAVLFVAAMPSEAFASGGGHGGGHGAEEKSSGGHGAPAHGDEIGEEKYDDLESPTGYRGLSLGEYKIRTYRSVSGQKNRVNFRLYARVKNEDVKEFRKLLKNRKIKVRDQVIVATRLVPVEDYDDPEFTKLRRRVRLRLRRTMPELPIHDIYVSDFTLLVENM